MVGCERKGRSALPEHAVDAVSYGEQQNRPDLLLPFSIVQSRVVRLWDREKINRLSSIRQAAIAG
jgi:hypothetical protein